MLQKYLISIQLPKPMFRHKPMFRQLNRGLYFSLLTVKTTVIQTSNLDSWLQVSTLWISMLNQKSPHFCFCYSQQRNRMESSYLNMGIESEFSSFHLTSSQVSCNFAFTFGHLEDHKHLKQHQVTKFTQLNSTQRDLQRKAGAQFCSPTWMAHSRHSLGCPTRLSAARPGGHGHPKGLSYLSAQLDVLDTPRHLSIAYLHVGISVEPFISQSVRAVCDRWGESLSKDVCLSPLTSERA